MDRKEQNDKKMLISAVLSKKNKEVFALKKRLFVVVTACGLSLVFLVGCTGKDTTEVVSEQTEKKEAASPETEEPSPVETAATFEDVSEYSEPDPEIYAAFDVTMPMTTNIEGCDTFTQIVNQLEPGKGYTNVPLGDTDVLLVSSGTYDDDGISAAIDAEVFYYDEDGPAFAGTVQSGGTAYPLSVKDGILYVGGNHFMTKVTMENGVLHVAEEAGVNYDTNGDATYYYGTEDTNYGDHTQEEAEKHLEELYAEFENAEVLTFDAINGE